MALQRRAWIQIAGGMRTGATEGWKTKRWNTVSSSAAAVKTNSRQSFCSVGSDVSRSEILTQTLLQCRAILGTMRAASLCRKLDVLHRTADRYETERKKTNNGNKIYLKITVQGDSIDNDLKPTFTSTNRTKFSLHPCLHKMSQPHQFIPTFVWHFRILSVCEVTWRSDYHVLTRLR